MVFLGLKLAGFGDAGGTPPPKIPRFRGVPHPQEFTMLDYK